MARPRTSTAEYVRPEQRLPEMAMLTTVPDYPPTLFGVEGKRRWQWYCQMLINNKRLAEPFLITIEEACRLHDELFAMRKELNAQQVRSNGKALVTYTKTSRKPNPLLGAIQSHSKLLSNLQDKLGCSPAAARNHNLPVMIPDMPEVAKPGRTPQSRPAGIDDNHEFM
jgi:phage terminase small subunit